MALTASWLPMPREPITHRLMDGLNRPADKCRVGWDKPKYAKNRDANKVGRWKLRIWLERIIHSTIVCLVLSAQQADKSNPKTDKYCLIIYHVKLKDIRQDTSCFSYSLTGSAIRVHRRPTFAFERMYQSVLRIWFIPLRTSIWNLPYVCKQGS